jgi:hypothetical protein
LSRCLNQTRNTSTCRPRPELWFIQTVKPWN